MARNRRNIRRNTRIREFLTSRNFFIIVGILLAIIILCIGINWFRQYTAKVELAKQQEEIRAQSEEIFSQISENIEETNKNISESDIIIKLSAVGDIVCSDEMLQDAYNKKEDSYDFTPMFSNVADLVNVSDIVMGTMEANFTHSTKYDEKNAPIEFANAVRVSGVNLVSVANEHSLDNGESGLKETKSNLESARFTVVGDKKNKNNVLIREVKGSKIAILSYTCLLNESQNNTNAINIFSEKQAKKDIDYAKEANADYICVMMHWGDELTETVNDEQKDIADFLVENGVNLIIGSHPSIVQKMEIRQNSNGENVFIAYSVGTYASSLSNEKAKEELVLNIELRKSRKDGKISLNKVDYTPIYMLDNGESSQNRFELIDMKETATSYKGDGTDKISKETYDKLVEGLNRLNKALGVNNNQE